MKHHEVKAVLEAQVYKGKIMQEVQEKVQLLSMTESPIMFLERCGRVCYKSEEKMTCKDPNCGIVDGLVFYCSECKERAEKFVKGIVKRGHESVIEHANATLLFITDRGMTHEQVRHRLCAYSQESTRYCNYGGKGIQVIQPDLSDAREKFVKAQDTWHEAMRNAENAYDALIEMGIKPQWARSVLPTCVKTEIVHTANFREWRHILNIRALNKGAHPQIRNLMKMALDVFMKSSAKPIFEDIAEQWEN